jgi:outer membrane lipoprotein carrier protein
MRLRILMSLAALLSAQASGLRIVSAQEPQAAAELAQALQRKYDTVRDFSSDFTQTYRGGVLKRQMTKSGRVLVKKPGRMRWEYKTPEEELFVSDGAKVSWYVPQDKQVIVSAVPQDDRGSTPALFLAGKGDITRDFTPSIVESPAGQPAGTRALKLVPRQPQPEYDWLIISIDPVTLALRGLVTGDAQGGTSSFSFTNLKENVGLADKLFVFTPPRGVDVVTDASTR